MKLPATSIAPEMKIAEGNVINNYICHGYPYCLIATQNEGHPVKCTQFKKDEEIQVLNYAHWESAQKRKAHLAQLNRRDRLTKNQPTTED